MKRNIVYSQDFGAPPPPPPPGFTSNPPPPPGNINPAGDGASTNAIIALVAGILCWFICPWIGGAVAWIMGKGELNKIERGESKEEGRTFAKIGMWLGIANIIVYTLGVLLYLLFVVILIGTATTR